MKSTRIKASALVLVMLLVLAMAAPAMAVSEEQESPRASAYINSCYARIFIENGYVKVYFRITGTGTMTSIGATGILIFDHDDDCVAVLDSSNTTGLMGSNVVFYQNTVTGLAADSGEQYYAIVGFKAQNAYGYDTTSFLTDYT